MTQAPPFPPPFPVDEYRSRLEAVRSVMAERHIDLLIVDETVHMVYLGGYGPNANFYQALLVPLDGEPFAVIRDVDESLFSEQSWLTDYVAYGDTDENPIKLAAETIVGRGYGASNIGVCHDSHVLTVNRAGEFESLLPDAEFVDFSGVMWEMRQVKSPLELAYLEVAAEICDRALSAGFDAARVGVSEREVHMVITAEALRCGASAYPQICQVISGPRSTVLHGSLGHHTLAEGDILHVEMVPRFRRYTSRIMRPKSIGAPTDEQMRTADTIISIQDDQISAMKPGADAKEVDRIVREGVLAAGLRDGYTNITGYTLGLVAITSDFTRVFKPGSDWKLQENQVFHMYSNAGGMAFSETVVVTPDGGRRLTKMDRRLFW